jgi:hypothetical protein
MAKKKTTKKKASTTKARKAPQANVSPTATGPAGSLFEGHVGAHFLLALLAGEADRKRRDYDSLFASNVVVSRRPETQRLRSSDSAARSVTVACRRAPS